MLGLVIFFNLKDHPQPGESSNQNEGASLSASVGVPKMKTPSQNSGNKRGQRGRSFSSRIADPANALKTVYAFPDYRQKEFQALVNSTSLVSLRAHPNLSVRLSFADPANGFEKEQYCRKAHRLPAKEPACAFTLRVVASSDDGVSGKIAYSEVVTDYTDGELSPACKEYAMCLARAQISKKVVADKAGLLAIKYNSVFRSDFDMGCDPDKLDEIIKTFEDDLRAFEKAPSKYEDKGKNRDVEFSVGQQERIIQYYRLIKADCA